MITNVRDNFPAPSHIYRNTDILGFHVVGHLPCMEKISADYKILEHIFNGLVKKIIYDM